uniref:Uncharacterized protein n=1 Tax=Rhizophora mucronata TaxID=61149 RepID=A0A2P2PAE4_RHIMU
MLNKMNVRMDTVKFSQILIMCKRNTTSNGNGNSNLA